EIYPLLDGTTPRPVPFAYAQQLSPPGVLCGLLYQEGRGSAYALAESVLSTSPAALSKAVERAASLFGVFTRSGQCGSCTREFQEPTARSPRRRATRAPPPAGWRISARLRRLWRVVVPTWECFRSGTPSWGRCPLPPQCCRNIAVSK